ncbi:unnamed protein product [Didymodactylos carnosus]|uniref:Interferon-induced transmembrane protein n=1 Tax=Didymodactylos carnosus TaxID=1234261 RepID=A0A814GFY4_9BILA|nr:unnamed protein product [Didymodactylos carnosus]CAF1608071.1 unnamed protein product [Didymodactylos carnosus]CAF3767502.1 unnamed protein product [Didymodactylos carnosus]CAF4420417.1 unnamed protein product [Didymodactylos carnosus]
MSNDNPASLPRAHSEPIHANRPTLSLANNEPASLNKIQPEKLEKQDLKDVSKIHTFYVWSIFNLIFLPFGLLCCYFSYTVNKFKKISRYELASLWSKRTFVLNLMTTLLAAAVVITVVMLHYDEVQRRKDSMGNGTTTQPYYVWQPGR